MNHHNDINEKPLGTTKAPIHSNTPGIIHGAEGGGLTGNSTGAHDNQGTLHGTTPQAGENGVLAGNHGTYGGAGTGGRGVDGTVPLSGAGAGLSKHGMRTVDVAPPASGVGGDRELDVGNKGLRNTDPGVHGHNDGGGVRNISDGLYSADERGTHGNGHPRTEDTHKSSGGGSLIGKMETAIGGAVGSQSLKEKGLMKEQEARAAKLEKDRDNHGHGVNDSIARKREHEGEDRFTTGGGTF